MQKHESQPKVQGEGERSEKSNGMYSVMLRTRKQFVRGNTFIYVMHVTLIYEQFLSSVAAASALV